MGVKYITDQGPDGLSVGKDSTDKISFFGGTPVDKPASTADIKDSLVELGLITDGGATGLNLDSGTLTAATVTATTVNGTNVNIANDTTITDAGNIILATTTGSMIGTASTQKLGFLGATPVVRQANTADIKDTLVAFGLLATGGATPLNLDSGTLTAATVATTDLTIANDTTITNAGNVILATSTGSMIGTASTQKLGFLGATPVVRQANTVDLKDALVSFGLVATGGATPLNLDAGALTCGALTATSVLGTGDVAATGHVTITDAKNIVLATTTGTKIGTATSQKLGFYNATPVDQAANNEDLKDVLVALGLIATGGATPLNLDAGTLTAGTVAATDITLANDMTVTDAGNIILATSTGTKIGTATSQKLGFFNATPIVRRSGAAQVAVATTAATSTTPYGFGSSQANAIVTLVNECMALLVAFGLAKGSA